MVWQEGTQLRLRSVGRYQFRNLMQRADENQRYSRGQTGTIPLLSRISAFREISTETDFDETIEMEHAPYVRITTDGHEKYSCLSTGSA